MLDTKAFGLPQRRQRVFLLASLDRDPRDVLFVDEESPINDRRSHDEVACGFYWTEGVRGLGWAGRFCAYAERRITIGIPSPPAMLLPDGGVVKPDIRDAERMQGFPSDWTKVVESASRRGHRWKLVGNAVTVDVAEWIGTKLARPGKYEAAGAGPVLSGKAWPRAAWNIGTGRYTTELSSWPVARRGPHFLEFLKFAPEPLSVKATSGFLGRAATGSLRFPPGFLEAVGAHLKRMQSSAAAWTNSCRECWWVQNGRPLDLDAVTSVRLGKIRQQDTAPEQLVRKLVQASASDTRLGIATCPDLPDLANRTRRWRYSCTGASGTLTEIAYERRFPSETEIFG